MAKKSNLLKNLLTTASAVAVLAGGVQSASAAAALRTTNGAADPAILNVGGLVGFNNAGYDAGNAYKVANQVDFKTDGAGAVVGTSFNLNGIDLAGKTFTVNVQDLTIGSIQDGTNAGKTLNFSVENDKTLTLTGTNANALDNKVAANNYTGLGDVKLTGANSVLNVTLAGAPVAGTPVALAGNISANAAGDGTLEVNSGVDTGEIVFNGTIGTGNALGAVTVGEAAAGFAIFNGTVNAETITVGSGAAGTATFNADVTSTNAMVIGTAGGGAGVVNLNANTDKGVNFGIANSSLTLGGAAAKTIGGAITTGANNAGLVNVANDFSVAGKVGDVGVNKIERLDFTVADKTFTIDNKTLNQGAHIGDIKFSQNGTLTLKNTDVGKVDQKIKFDTVTITKDANGVNRTSTLLLDDSIGVKNVTVTGKIGDAANGAALSELLVGASVGTANTALIFDAGAAEQSIAKVTLGGATNITLTGNAGANGATYNFGEFNLSGDGLSNLKVTTSKVVVKALDEAVGLQMGTSALRFKEISFDGDRELDIGNNVEFHAQSLNSGVANQGKIVFLGNGVFDATQAKTINTITAVGNADSRAVISQNIGANGAITGGAGTLAFGGNVTTAGDILGGNAATSVLEFNGNVQAANIKANGADNGTVRFVNKGAVTVTGAFGSAAGNAFKTLEFAGESVDFAGPFIHRIAGSAINFTSQSDTPTVVTLKTPSVAAGDLSNGETTINNTGKAGVTPVLQFGDLNIGGGAVEYVTFKKVGSDANHLVELRYTGNKALDVNVGDAVAVKTTSVDGLKFANFTTNNNAKGAFEFAIADSQVNSLGNADLVLEKVTFTESGEVLGDAYSNKFEVTDAKTATFNGVVSNGRKPLANAQFLLNGATATAKFNDGSRIDLAVTSDAAANGVTYLGSDKGGNVVINKDVQSGKIISEASTLVFRDTAVVNKRKLSGEITGTNTVYDIGATEVTFLGDSTKLAGTIGVKTTIAVNGNEVTGGHINVQTNAFNTSDLAQINVEILDPEFNLPDIDSPLTFTFLDTDVQASLTSRPVDAVFVNATGGSSLAKATGFMDSKGRGKIVISNDAANVLSNDLKINNGTEADRMNAAILLESKSVRKELGSITNSDKRVELIKRLPTTDTTAVLSDVNARIGDSLVARMDNLAGLQGSPVTERVVGDAGTSGVAAGDNLHRYGAWVSPFVAMSTQKARGEAAGYRAGTVGANVGFDTRANDDMIIGASASVLGTKVKYKNFKSGDQAKVNSVMFSVYGMQQINDNWFAEGVATFGSSKVNTTEKRVTGNTTYATVKGDYTSTSFGGQGFFGYSFVAMNNYVVTPMFGARYTSVNDSGYTETGDTAQVLTVSKKAVNKLEGIIGARVAAGNFDLSGISVNPEVHGFVSHDMTGKKAKTTLKLADAATPLASKNAKLSKTFYNVGFGLNAEQGMVEYGIGYDLHLAHKFVGHQGTLKVRANF